MQQFTLNHPSDVFINREGLQAAPHRFEIYRGIVHCYLALQRSREAINIAANSLHHIGNTPRTFTVTYLYFFISCIRVRD